LKNIVTTVKNKINDLNVAFQSLPFFLDNLIMKFSKDSTSKCGGSRDPFKIKKVSNDNIFASSLP